jgi:hypothetical protein
VELRWRISLHRDSVIPASSPCGDFNTNHSRIFS